MINDSRYTSRDFMAIRDDVISYIKTRTTEWTDFNESDLGMVFVEVLSGIADMLNYYLDNQALEAFFSTARQPKDIKSHLESYNYKLQDYAEAVGEVTFTNTSYYGDTEKYPYSVIIPKDTEITNSGQNNIVYLTESLAEIPIGSRSVTVSVFQGDKKELVVSSEELAKSYKFYLPKSMVIPTRITISSDGEPWTMVEDAFVEIYGGRKFSVHTDSRGKSFILFTYDWKEYLPSDPLGSVTITYYVTKASEGVVDRNTLNIISTPIYDSEGNSVQLKVTNENKTAGAYSSVNYTLEKANARNYIKSMDTPITLRDYNAHVLKSPYILRANTFDWQRDRTICPYPFQVVSYVVTPDSDTPSSEIINQIQEDINSKAILMTRLTIKSAEFIPINIKLKVDMVRYTSTDTLSSSIRNVLSEYFSVDNTDFEEVHYSHNIEALIKPMNGILDVRVIFEINGEEMSSTNLTQIQYPKLGEVNITYYVDGKEV